MACSLRPTRARAVCPYQPIPAPGLGQPVRRPPISRRRETHHPSPSRVAVPAKIFVATPGHAPCRPAAPGRVKTFDFCLAKLAPHRVQGGYINSPITKKLAQATDMNGPSGRPFTRAVVTILVVISPGAWPVRAPHDICSALSGLELPPARVAAADPFGQPGGRVGWGTKRARANPKPTLCALGRIRSSRLAREVHCGSYRWSFELNSSATCFAGSGVGMWHCPSK